MHRHLLLRIVPPTHAEAPRRDGRLGSRADRCVRAGKPTRTGGSPHTVGIGMAKVVALDGAPRRTRLGRPPGSTGSQIERNKHRLAFLVVQGKRNIEIAREFGVSSRTIRTWLNDPQTGSRCFSSRTRPGGREGHDGPPPPGARAPGAGSAGETRRPGLKRALTHWVAGLEPAATPQLSHRARGAPTAGRFRLSRGKTTRTTPSVCTACALRYAAGRQWTKGSRPARRGGSAVGNRRSHRGCEPSRWASGGGTQAVRLGDDGGQQHGASGCP